MFDEVKHKVLDIGKNAFVQKFLGEMRSEILDGIQWMKDHNGNETDKTGDEYSWVLISVEMENYKRDV